MEKVEYIFSRINIGWGINSYCYNMEGRLEYTLCGQNDAGDMYEVPEEIREHIRAKHRIIHAPVIYQEDENFYYWGFEDKVKRFYIFGAVTTEMLTELQKKRYCFKRNIEAFNMQFPVISIMELMNIVCISYFMLTEEQIDEEALMQKNNLQGVPDEKDAMAYALSSEEEEREHASYEEEQRWLDNIRNGVMKTGKKMTRAEMLTMDKIGIMADKNSLKQTEYMVVTAITLMTRAAIQGGCRPEKMYRLSDLYLQKTAKCRNSLEMCDVQKQALIDFTHSVKMHKEQDSQDKYVEQCKDYIAQNLYREIRIEKLAEAIGLNRCYLSDKFSKAAGMSIKQYIMKEKLNAAANLLKYSNAEVGAVASYMHFGSPSRFSQYFKKQYGLTPLEYRKKYKLAEYSGE